MFCFTFYWDYACARFLFLIKMSIICFSAYFQDHLDATEDVALNFGDEDEILNRRKKFRFVIL